MSQSKVTGHKWCNNCVNRKRDGALVDNETGEEIECEESVDADLAMIDGRAFELVGMPAALKDELDGYIRVDGPVTIRAEFDLYENLTYVAKL